MQHRQFYLDNICGLLIVHMIFVVHQPLFCKYSNSSIDFALELLSFFMAWFSDETVWFIILFITL